MAFMDIEIPLGNGFHMMHPKVEARTLQALDLQPSDNVLEIGTGTGHLTAHLAHLGGHVSSVDIDSQASDQAKSLFTQRGIHNVTFLQGDASQGWEDGKLYDVIVFTGAMHEVPQSYFAKLKAHGRLFCVVGEGVAMQACLWTRLSDTKIQMESLFETQLAYLRGAEKKAAFAL
jgi:protein-L-isoaspartate(D-aspartate) O-methyltransferase